MDKFARSFLDDPGLDAFLVARRFTAVLPNYRPDIVEGVGLVVIAFQRLEMQLQRLILELHGVDPRTQQARSVVEALPFSKLVNDLRQIAKREGSASNLHALHDACKRAEGIRDRVVHSVYSEDGRRKGSNFVEYEPDDLKKLAGRIFDISSAVGSVIPERFISLCQDVP
jgi:hypothetical protein